MTQFKYSKRVPADGTDAVGAIYKQRRILRLFHLLGDCRHPNCFLLKK